jgi:hypothetical protein
MGEPKGFLVVPIGFNPSDDLRSLELDASDNLKVAFAAAAQGLVGPHGWVSGAWQKSALPFGPSGTVTRSFSNTSLPAGTSIKDDSIVPAGELWVITVVIAVMFSATITSMYPMVKVGGIYARIFSENAPITTYRYDRQCQVVLMPGDNLAIGVVGATLNDDVYMDALGYRMDIDQ